MHCPKYYLANFPEISEHSFLGKTLEAYWKKYSVSRMKAIQVSEGIVTL